MKSIPDDFTEGDALTFEDVNEILAALREVQTQIQTGKSQVRKAKTPSGGIPANGSANCTSCVWNPFINVWADGTVQIKVYNPSSASAIAGSTRITIAFVSGRWECVVEPC